MCLRVPISTPCHPPHPPVDSTNSQDTLAVSVSQPAEDWSQPPLLFGKLSAVLYAAAQKKQMYRNHTLTLSVVDVPTVSEPADTTHYRRLLGAAPSHAIGVPYLLHCLIEQVVISTLEANDAASLSAEDELDAIAALLNMEVSEAAVVPQTAARMAVEAAASASEKTLLIPNGDMVAARELRPPPLGTTLEGDSAAQAAAERSLFQGLPRPGKARRSMPSEPSLSSEERGTERTELHHFSRFNPSQIDGSMCLRGLAKLVNGSDPHRGSRGTGWLLADRPWIEELSASAFAQVLTEMRATSHRPARLNSYHARDDVLLYVQHDAVPPERESVEAWRCELYDLVDRKFDAWHKWLMRGDGNEVVPSAPLPPFGGSLYKFDERNADLLVTTTCLYPADHQILRYSMSSRGATCVIEPRNGGYACIARGGGTPAPPARFDISFADHGRAVAAFEEEEWRVTVGGADGLQVSMTCSGVVHLLHPPVYTPIAAAVTPTEAAILQLSGLRVTGAPQADGVEFLLLRVTLGGVDLPEAAAVTSTVPISAEAISWAGQQLSIQLPVGSPRPALLSIELWGREPDKDPDASPLATAELLLPEGTSGALAGALSAPAFAGSEVAISGFFAVEAPSRGEQIAEPLSREVSRSIFATGTIITTLEDGTKRVYHRNGNLAERKVSGPHANCWVCTNTAGLRVGTTAADDQFYVAPVAVSASTDAVTHNVITTRADGTLTLTRADGSRVIQFADGTSIHADKEAVKNPLRGVLQVRCEGSPPVAINLRLGETKVMGLDGTNAKADGQSVAIDHLDGTKLKLGHNGTLEFLPAALAWQVGRASDDPNGVYQLDLAAGTLYTKDPQGSSFSVTLGETHTVDLVLQDELAGSVGEKQDWDDDPDWSHPPRLFICRPDGTGVELLRKTDVAAFLSQRELDSEAGSSMHLREPVMGDTTAEVNTWVWRDWMQQTVQELAAERGNSDVQQLLALLPKIKYEPAKATLLHFRRMLRREPLSSADRAVLETEVAEMEEYRLQEDERAKAMHIVDTRTAGEKTDQLELQAELMKVRPPPRIKSTERFAVVPPHPYPALMIVITFPLHLPCTCGH